MDSAPEVLESKIARPSSMDWLMPWQGLGRPVLPHNAEVKLSVLRNRIFCLTICSRCLSSTL